MRRRVSALASTARGRKPDQRQIRQHQSLGLGHGGVDQHAIDSDAVEARPLRMRIETVHHARLQEVSTLPPALQDPADRLLTSVPNMQFSVCMIEVPDPGVILR